MFAALKATSAAAAARQQEAQAVLSGLQLQQQELLQLWRECSKRDKDKSGFLTGEGGSDEKWWQHCNMLSTLPVCVRINQQWQLGKA